MHAIIKDQYSRGKSITDTLDTCRDRWPSIPLLASDVHNARKKLKRGELNGRTSLQALLEKLEEEDSEFLPYYTHDQTDSLTRLLFFHKQSLEL